MILVIIFAIGLFIGGFLGSALAFGVQAHLRVKRRLKAAEKALEARETASQQEPESHFAGRSWPEPPPGYHYRQVAPGKLALVPDQPDSKPTPDFIGGIGPTAIANREKFEEAKAREQTTPKFAHPGVLNPQLNDIADAAREATNGGKPN